MKRNRQETTRKIVYSARRFLVEYGFHEWGVNQVARYSGFDKVLLYRYFNDLDGLLAFMVEDFAFWPKFQEREFTPEEFLDATFHWMIEDTFRLKVYQSISEFPEGLHMQRRFLEQRRIWCHELTALIQGHQAYSFAEFCADSLIAQATWHSREHFRNPWDFHPENVEPKSRNSQDTESDELPTELL